jgi:hypothetical protein
MKIINDTKLSYEEQSLRLNILGNLCRLIYNPPIEFLAELVEQYDSLNDRNSAMILSCFCMVELNSGKTFADIDEIMADDSRREIAIEHFVNAVIERVGQSWPCLKSKSLR